MKSALRLEALPRSTIWTLYCRARHAHLGKLFDPDAVMLMNKLHLDRPELLLGYPDPCFAKRAALFDQLAQTFLDTQPNAQVISLGEGLETQRSRLQNYRTWITVDLPQVIALRDELYPPGPSHQHVASDVTQLDWDRFENAGPNLIIAQGLFMYLPLPEVRRILRACEALFAPSLLLFDVVPSWVHRLSALKIPLGLKFRIPKMAWGGRDRFVRNLVTESLHKVHRTELHRCPLPSGPLPFADQTWVCAVHWDGHSPQ